MGESWLPTPYRLYRIRVPYCQTDPGWEGEGWPSPPTLDLADFYAKSYFSPGTLDGALNENCVTHDPSPVHCRRSGGQVLAFDFSGKVEADALPGP